MCFFLADLLPFYLRERVCCDDSQSFLVLSDTLNPGAQEICRTQTMVNIS